MKVNEHIIAYLKNELRVRNWIAADLADATGLSRSSVSRILNGKQPTLRETGVDGLCQGLGITSMDLLLIGAGKQPRAESSGDTPATKTKGLSVDLNKMSPAAKEFILDQAVVHDKTPGQVINDIIRAAKERHDNS